MLSRCFGCRSRHMMCVRKCAYYVMEALAVEIQKRKENRSFDSKRCRVNGFIDFDCAAGRKLSNVPLFNYKKFNQTQPRSRKNALARQFTGFRVRRIRFWERSGFANDERFIVDDTAKSPVIRLARPDRRHACTLIKEI